MVLVTGGTGLVGAHLLLKLVEKENSIKSIFRSTKSKEKTLNIFKSYKKEYLFEKIEWIKADILDILALEEAFEGVDYVYHCAAIVSFHPADKDQMMKINIDGTSNVVNLALEKKVKKLCYVSSVATIGEYLKEKYNDEDAVWTKVKSTSNYSISKYYAENEVWRASEEGLSVVIVNPSTILGYGNWNEGSLAIIKKVYDGLKFYPPGSNSFVGVKDVVKIMMELMNSPIKGQRYILSGENISFRQLFTTIALSFGKKPPTIKASRSMANLLLASDAFANFFFRKKRVLTSESIASSFRNTCYSNDKIKKELEVKFQPVEEVMEECADKYIEASS